MVERCVLQGDGFIRSPGRPREKRFGIIARVHAYSGR